MAGRRRFGATPCITVVFNASPRRQLRLRPSVGIESRRRRRSRGVRDVEDRFDQCDRKRTNLFCNLPVDVPRLSNRVADRHELRSENGRSASGCAGDNLPSTYDDVVRLDGLDSLQQRHGFTQHERPFALRAGVDNCVVRMLRLKTEHDVRAREIVGGDGPRTVVREVHAKVEADLTRRC